MNTGIHVQNRNRLRTWRENVAFVWSFARKLLLFFGIGSALLIAFGWCISRFANNHFWWYSMTIAGPALLAFLTVGWTLFRSGYVKAATEFGSMREIKAFAGLGFIRSTSKKVLLNRQQDPPWKELWCLPGGYFNKEKKDYTPRDTASRRAQELTGVAWKCEAKPKIASTTGSQMYKQLIIDTGLSPVLDELYLIVKDGRETLIPETDVTEKNDLRWWSVQEVRERSVEIPPHMLEIILFLLDQEASKKPLNYWDLSDEYYHYALATELTQGA